MALIPRYIIRQIVLVAVFVAAALTMAIWLSQSLRFLDVIVNRGLPAGIALHFLALMLPSLLTIILPLAVFIAVLFVYYRLIADSELVIVRSSGVSNLGLARPAVTVALVATALCLFLTTYGMPASFRAFRDLERTIRDDYAQILVEPGVFTDAVDGVTIFARARDSDGRLSGVIVHDVRDPLNRITYTADTGAFVGSASGPRVVLDNGTYQKTESGKDLSVLYFDRAVIGMSEVDQGRDPFDQEPREMFLHELFQGPYHSEAARLQQRAEGHQRIVIPIYTLTFTVLALAALLHGSVHRYGRALRVGIAVLSVVAVQSAGFALQSLAARLPAMAPLMYLVPLAAAFAGLAFLIGPFRGIRRRAPRPATAVASLSPA